MTNTSLHRSHKHLHICQTLADVRCFSASRKAGFVRLHAFHAQRAGSTYSHFAWRKSIRYKLSLEETRTLMPRGVRRRHKLRAGSLRLGWHHRGK